MKTPLPQSLTQKVRRSTGAHTGLWFDKFCDQWPTNGWSLKSVADRNPKLDWIRTVAEKAAGDADLLGEHAGRMVALARACGGAVLHFKTASRFATGLGREHPIENGFVWHSALDGCLQASALTATRREPCAAGAGGKHQWLVGIPAGD